MVLVGHGRNDNRVRYGRRWIGWFFILTVCIFMRDYYLQYSNFLSLRDKEAVVVSPVIPVYTLRKKTEIKTVAALKRLPGSLVPWRSLNWLNE